MAAVILLLLVTLSFSGCVESGEEQPDEMPDVYESAQSSENSDIPENTASDGISIGQLTVTSPAFENGNIIPEKYTCDGVNINPALIIGDVSDDVVSLLLIMDDPDALSGTFTHWVVWNIDPQEQIPENDVMGIEGLNGAGMAAYIGPCPPSGTHRYFFKFYGLDTELDIESGSERSLVEDAMNGHIIAYGELVGLYSRS
jgi:Raf kinase inhibitor-like YbhB/YbcL family protein